ncbi:HAD hydrolase-like protein [Patescibacteria group bacterium]|nr:HAD hydrolase-like protein [Patescibacteria group bacterium]
MFKNKKKIIFFDGDGTIWYPQSSKRKKAPHWIYSDKNIGDNYLEHLILTPSALVLLKKLKKLGIILILLSTYPHFPKEADILQKAKIKHFKLEEIFDDFYTSRNKQEGKGEAIVRILRKKHILKSQALMVGDSYRFDYLSAKRVGVDALLIKSEYMKHPPRGRKIQKTISDLKDLAGILK